MFDTYGAVYSLSPSMAEHIGAHGSWGHESASERAIDFPVQDLEPELRALVEDNLAQRKRCDLVALAGSNWHVRYNRRR